MRGDLPDDAINEINDDPVPLRVVNFGLSQEALAFEAGLDRTYVSSVERGERNIALLNLKRLATALGVEVRALKALPGGCKALGMRFF